MSHEDYEAPEDPDDPEAAALELIVSRAMHVAARAFAEQGHEWEPTQLRAKLQEFATMLEVDGAFRGMTWHDAKLAAGIIATDLASTTTTPGQAMRAHAIDARRDVDEIPWNDHRRAGGALEAAAMIYPRVAWA